MLLTVLGLRSGGHQAALVAHRGGELRRRAAEGLDLIPLAPRSEMDLRAAWQLSRALRQLGPNIVHAHDAHAVAMAALARSLGSSEPPPRLVASRRVDFSHQEERLLTVEVPADRLLYLRLVYDPVDARQRWGTARTHRGRV